MYSRSTLSTRGKGPNRRRLIKDVFPCNFFEKLIVKRATRLCRLFLIKVRSFAPHLLTRKKIAIEKLGVQTVAMSLSPVPLLISNSLFSRSTSKKSSLSCSRSKLFFLSHALLSKEFCCTELYHEKATERHGHNYETWLRLHTISRLFGGFV